MAINKKITSKIISWTEDEFEILEENLTEEELLNQKNKKAEIENGRNSNGSK